MLDRRQFETWLKANSDKPVGKPCSDADCPLANWLDGLLDQPVYVSNTAVTSSTGVTMLPLWAEDFVALVDSSGPYGVLTGSEALELLDRVQS